MVFLAAAVAAAKSLQSCSTLCDPIDSSPPGSSVPGILQARILEWVAISFSKWFSLLSSSLLKDHKSTTPSQEWGGDAESSQGRSKVEVRQASIRLIHKWARSKQTGL